MATRPNVQMETLPCGCRMGTGFENGQPTFVYEPCDTSCTYYQYVVEESKRQGKPLELRSVD